MREENRLLRVVLLASALMIQVLGCALFERQRLPTKVEGWTTHCFGRYLVDLPPGATIRAQYKLRGNPVEYLAGETPESLEAKLRKRQAELEVQMRNAGRGPMFYDRMNHGDAGSTSLLSWKGPHSTRVLYRESYFVASSPWRAFKNSGDVSVDRIDVARRNADDLARKIVSRAGNSIPEIPGFCIDGGMIAGKEFQDESFTVGVELPGYPNANVYIDARTGTEEDRLLDRVGGFFFTALRALAPGQTVLRKGNRNVGPIEAQEFATAASEKGQRVYAFAWESQGKNSSLGDQNISVTLQVLEQAVVSERTPYQPAFKSDEEALQLWDNLVDSVRLRPGAV